MSAPVLLIVAGPTASGKSWLGAHLAQALDGEVISADAFAVYRGMDIGTAKPEPRLRQLVPHHLLDGADPQRRYSAGEFLRDADAAIAACWARGKQPVVVGGTLFYVRALLYGLFAEPPKDEELRQQLEARWSQDPQGVFQQLRQLDPTTAARLAPRDKQRVLRALEVCLLAGRPMSQLWAEYPLGAPRYAYCYLALNPPRPALHARIGERVEDMWQRGLLAEAKRLLAQGVSPQAHAFKAIGYREALAVLTGQMSEAEAKEKTIAATRQLAKRQLTWLRKERGVRFFAGFGEEALPWALTAWEESHGK